MKSLLRKHKSVHPLSVLLIEEDEALTEILKEVFRYEGYHFRCISTAGNVLKLMGDFHPSVVVIDYSLPKDNHGEICNLIKGHVDFCMVPIVVYSAYSKETLSLADYQYDAYIEKPFDLGEFVGKIKKLATCKSESH